MAPANLPGYSDYRGCEARLQLFGERRWVLQQSDHALSPNHGETEACGFGEIFLAMTAQSIAQAFDIESFLKNGLTLYDRPGG
jgi:hypothetical protein